MKALKELQLFSHHLNLLLFDKTPSTAAIQYLKLCFCSSSTVIQPIFQGFRTLPGGNCGYGQCSVLIQLRLEDKNV